MIKLISSDAIRNVGGSRMALEYRVISDKVMDDEGIEHTVYGIAIYKKNKENAVLVKSIHDIFTNIRDAHMLADYCEFTHVHPDKLLDVIEYSL